MSFVMLSNLAIHKLQVLNISSLHTLDWISVSTNYIDLVATYSSFFVTLIEHSVIALDLAKLNQLKCPNVV